MPNSIACSNSSNSYLQDPSPSSLDMTGNWTFAAWIKYGGASGNNYVLHVQTQSGNFLCYVFVGDDGGTQKLKIDTLEFTGFSQIHLIGPEIVSGTWYFIVARFDVVAKSIALSVNNTSYGSGNGLNNFGGVFNYHEIGGKDGATTNSFDGLIYLPGFWSRNLTAGEESNLYNSGYAKLFSDYSGLGLLTGIVTAYDAVNSGNIGLDATGNGNDLTNINAATQSSVTPYQLVSTTATSGIGSSLVLGTPFVHDVSIVVTSGIASGVIIGTPVRSYITSATSGKSSGLILGSPSQAISVVRIFPVIGSSIIRGTI